MARFYSPNNAKPKAPVALCCIPAKIVMAVLEAIAIIICIGTAIGQKDTSLYFSVFVGSLHAAAFYGIVAESIKLMVTYFLFQVMGLFIPVTVLFLSFLGSIGSVAFSRYAREFLNKENVHNNAFLCFVVAFIVLSIYIYFMCVTWTLIRHYSDKKKIARCEPEFDTTQGLYQYNQDAYDGCDETGDGNKLYPLL